MCFVEVFMKKLYLLLTVVTYPLPEQHLTIFQILKYASILNFSFCRESSLISMVLFASVCA